MPGFPFGPTRPNTRAGLPLTSSVLMPAVRRSLAARGSGAAVALVIGRKGIVTAMATPDARICRRVRRVATLAGSRVFQASSASRTFWIAASRSKGGTLGDVVIAMLLLTTAVPARAPRPRAVSARPRNPVYGPDLAGGGG